MVQKSPLAPIQFPRMPRISGVNLATGNCGFKLEGSDDLLLIKLEANTVIAGIFTRSLTAAAPVEWCKTALRSGQVRAIVVNSGNANAFTGRVGVSAVQAIVNKIADTLSCSKNQVFISSTGVIGVPLPVDKLIKKLPILNQSFSQNNWKAAAKTITTTDTFAKGSTRATEIDGKQVIINGIAKGSGMISPNMGTMLGYIFTDAKIGQSILQKALQSSAEKSFNSITIDGDTSTNDTLLICATARVSHPEIEKLNDPRFQKFRSALDEVMVDLAQQIVRDGEGAQKFVSITVKRAISNVSAKRIAFSIANSPLVKTAIAGEDPNWGRIVMAVGKSGEKADPNALNIQIGGVQITKNGSRIPNYNEEPVAEHMRGTQIEICVDVGIGKGKATVWTCDLTHGYIDINADYRT